MTRPSVDFQVIKQEDLSYGGVVRTQYRIRLNGEANEQNIRAICAYLISEATKAKPSNAISFLFYTPESDPEGAYTAGKGEWAPNGVWADAGKVKTGDYSQNKLVVTVGSSLGQSNPAEESTLPIATRKEIFRDLVSEQDKGVGDSKAYEIVADRYKTDLNNVRRIAVEGVKKGWPMP